MIGATIGGAIVGGIMSGINGAINNKYAKSAANKQYDRQLDFWNRQNEYNLPKNMVARLKDAGLNPALMYGAGTGASEAGVLSSVPGNEYAQRGVLPEGALSSMNPVDTAMKLAQLRNIDADTRQKNVSAGFDEESFEDRLQTIQLDNAIRYVTKDNKELEGKLLKIQEYIQSSTQDDQIANIKDSAKLTNAKWKSEVQNFARLAEEVQNLRARNTYERQQQFWLLNNMIRDFAIKGIEMRLKEQGIEVSKAQAAMYYSIGRLNDYNRKTFLPEQYKNFEGQRDLWRSQKDLNEWNTMFVMRQYGWLPAEKIVGMLNESVRTGVQAYGAFATGGASTVLSGMPSSSGSWSSSSTGGYGY